MTDPIQLRRLIPECGETILAEQVASLDLAELAPEDRPHVITNFALTLDGHSTIRGKSGQIGSATDTAMLVALRTRVDAVMIGAGTMRVERYGLAADSLMVIVSGRLDLPWDAPLFTAAGGKVLIFTCSAENPPPTAATVEVVRHQGAEVDLAAALAYLRRERGVRSLLCEGGARLHAQLIDRGLIDELFVTHAPKLGGGVGPGLVSGLDELERPVKLEWLLADDATGELFARYRVAAAS